MWDKDVFTTGEVAKICSVTIRTVIKWFESGDLEGYKIPGSKDRRIPRDNLVRFMERHGIPMRGLDGGRRRRRVLVADDDRELVDILRDDLADLGLFDIRVAHSGYEAGMVTVDFKPDLLLLDYNLGDITGVEVVKLIRDNDALKRTRIILMSGMLRGKKAEQAVEAGADAFLPKPFEFGALKAQVFELLEMA